MTMMDIGRCMLNLSKHALSKQIVYGIHIMATLNTKIANISTKKPLFLETGAFRYSIL